MTAGTVDVDIHGIAHGGDGVGRLPDGMALFVPGALPGERVTVEVVERKARFGRGVVRSVVTASDDRAQPPCPYVAAGCGGCDLQHATPAAQRELKTRVVREQLERIGRVEVDVLPTLAVGPDEGYRTRTQLHAADGLLGYHRSGTHEVVPIDHCLVLHPAVQAIVDQLGTTTADAIEVRAHASTATSAITLRPGPGGLAVPDGDFDVLLEQPDGTTAALRGDGVLAEVVDGRTYRFDATSFFQVNTGGAEALVRHVLQALDPVDGALVWDLYAGVGLLSLPLAAAGADVVAVEGHEPAAEWARRNADTAGVAVDVRAAAVERVVVGGAASPYDLPDAVVLDPPRAGAGREVMDALGGLDVPRIVYVACDPAALARDVRAAAGHGFRVRSVQPLDLFPHTHHVEAVAVLQR